MRRDIAMLGIIHRCVIDSDPPQFNDYFVLKDDVGTGFATRRADNKHCRQLRDLRTSSSTDWMKRSILGLIAIWNMLPEEIVMEPDTKDFQGALQDLVKVRAVAGCDNWKLSLSPRVPLREHSLR